MRSPPPPIPGLVTEGDQQVLLAAIIDSFEGELFICGQDYRLSFMNQRLRERLGQSALDEPCHLAVHGLVKPCAQCVLQKKSGGSSRWEHRDPRDGRWRYVVASPLSLPDGTRCTLGLMIDISEHKRAEQELAESRDIYRGLVESLPLGCSSYKTTASFSPIPSYPRPCGWT